MDKKKGPEGPPPIYRRLLSALGKFMDESNSCLGCLLSNSSLRSFRICLATYENRASGLFSSYHLTLPSTKRPKKVSSSSVRLLYMLFILAPLLKSCGSLKGGFQVKYNEGDNEQTLYCYTRKENQNETTKNEPPPVKKALQK